ncbi:4203_t:CDS:10 [Ambispora gerdemannii]|uniref:4203_t:CDS:1 n=1 Tax=Ambispora gerdemannii TaxID=144530 RepID=A0A9N8VYZ1_9GLOM|nr:4203_t:CDS:10 [Ambispora gerdemannii]
MSVEDIRKALALSVEEIIDPVEKARARRELEERNRALDLAMQEAEEEQALYNRPRPVSLQKNFDFDNKQEDSTSASSSVSNNSSVGLGGLSSFLVERKEMERERLERAEKRRANSSLVPTFDKKTKIVNGQIVQVSDNALKYANGVLKLTYIPDFRGDYVKFEDLIEKSKLKRAFLSCFVVSLDWVQQNFPSQANIVLAKQRDYSEQKPGVYKTKFDNIILVNPPMLNSDFGCFHAKLMLLYYDNWMRVVITSANLIPMDWEQMENVVFVQDFPLLDTPASDISQQPEFAQDLSAFVLAMREKGAQDRVLIQVTDKLRHYDFSKAKAKIVGSVSGLHQGFGEMKKHGHVKLGQVVKELCGEMENVEIECQTSSLGGLTRSFLEEFYRSARGMDPLTGPAPRRRITKKDKESGIVQEPSLPPISIVFPTESTIRESKDGPAGASTICFSRKHYNKDTFPKSLLKDCISERSRTLMHSKFILARKIQKDDNDQNLAAKNEERDSEDVANDKVGCVTFNRSHNFTESAWGKITNSRTTGQQQLRIINWELGVVFPLFNNMHTLVEFNKSGRYNLDDWFVQHGVPVPYQRPPSKYSTTDVPWTALAYVRAWHLVDARDRILGRMSTNIAITLMGKHKPIFDPASDCGDYVVVVNAKEIKVTGRKAEQKLYRHHTGYPGGLKEIPYKRMMETKPTEIIRKAVSGMLPKNRLRNVRLGRLFIFTDDQHPYEGNIIKFYDEALTSSLFNAPKFQDMKNNKPNKRNNTSSNLTSSSKSNITSSNLTSSSKSNITSSNNSVSNTNSNITSGNNRREEEE